MNRARIVPVLTLALALAALLAAAGCNQSVSTELPDDLLALLPAQPAVLVSLTSLDDFEARRTALADSSHGAPLLDGGALAELALAAWLAETLPAVMPVMARDRPLVLAVGVPAPMTNQMDMVLVVPLNPDIEIGDLTDGETFKSQLVLGDYVALSSEAGYAAADSIPALGLDRLPGLVSVAVDLQGILAMYRPFVDMGLAAMAAIPPTDADSTGQQPPMTPAQAAAMTDLVRMVMDSAQRTDMTLDLDADEVRFASRFDMVPGSALVPGPQPDFARALELSGSLPADAHLKMALALDQTHQMDLSLDYYRASMAADLKRLPPDLAADIAAWFDGYLASLQYVSAPMALGLGMGLEGIEMQVVLESSEADAVLDHLDRQLQILGNLDIGLTVTPVDAVALADVSIRGWDLAWDDARMAVILGVAEEVDLAPTGGQLAQTLGVLRRLGAGLRGFTTGGLVVLTTTTDWAELGDMLADVRDPRAADAQLATLAAAGGPATREVVQGNLGLLLVWIIEAMGMGDEEMLAELRDQPMEMTMVMTQEGPRVASTMTVGVQGLRRTVRAIQALGAQKHAE